MATQQSTAAAIVDEVGGPGNIISLTHCATRLRFELKDAGKVNQDALEKISGVMGAVPQSGDRYQVVIGGAVQGVYELGSTFKIFAVAQALEMGLVNPQTMIETKTPMYFGKHRIKDYRNYGPQLTVTDVIAKSSNVGTARLATMIGGEAQQDFLRRMGFFEPTKVELAEAPTGRPLLPPRWGELVTLTVSYGHGMSASPLHLAAGYAMLANGGRRVTPTLIHGAARTPGEQIIRPEVARQAVDMMRKVVTEGTASFGEVAGYQVAGKTGTAEKPKPGGGYWDERNINTFASVFPASDPKYVLIVSMDEAVDTSGSEPRRTAGWTAVPIAAEVVRRTAPLLGLRPVPEPADPEAITLVRN